MNKLESRLADGMRRIADQSGGPPPTRDILVRGRKARRARRVTLMGGACLVVAALVAVPAMVVREDRQAPRPDGATAQMRLVAALSSSQNLSYRLRITSAGTDDAGRRWVYEGVFDPATRTGRLSAVPGNPAGPYDQRLVEGTRYISHSGGPYRTEPGSFDRLAYSGRFGGALIGTADPQQLFATLQAANATVTQTGPSSYHFEADLPPIANVHSDRLVGDVTINGDNRIEKVTYERTAQITHEGRPLNVIEANTVELSGYGDPVTVERPADAVPAG